MKEIPNWYQVKYRQTHARNGERVCRGKWKFGLLERYSEEAKQAWPKAYIVDDAITGQLYRVPSEGFEVVEIPTGEFKPISFSDEDTVSPWDNEYSDYVNKEWQKAKAKSDKIQGCKKGKMFWLGVADGCAHYVVVRAGKNTVTVEWRGFGADRYVDQVLGYGGSFPRRVIENLV